VHDARVDQKSQHVYDRRHRKPDTEGSAVRCTEAAVAVAAVRRRNHVASRMIHVVC
jgi:hypothetical protein